MLRVTLVLVIVIICFSEAADLQTVFAVNLPVTIPPNTTLSAATILAQRVAPQTALVGCSTAGITRCINPTTPAPPTDRFTSYRQRIPIPPPNASDAFTDVDRQFAETKTSAEQIYASRLTERPPEDPNFSLDNLQAMAAIQLNPLSSASAIKPPSLTLDREQIAEFVQPRRNRLARQIAVTPCVFATPISCDATSQFRTVDGSCNNLGLPILGRSKTPLARLRLGNYQDGLNSPRTLFFSTSGILPSARTVSRAVHTITSDLSNINTHLLMNLGQFLDHDLTLTPAMRGGWSGPPQCCPISQFQSRPECFAIPVVNDPEFLTTCINFARSAPTTDLFCNSGQREQLDDLTHYLDASNVYGSDGTTSNRLRLFSKGLLKFQTLNGETLLPPQNGNAQFCQSSTCKFDAGDSRNSEQIGLASIHTLFLRVHNKIASLLPQSWTDEKIYQTSRKILGAIWQHIVYSEFLPVVIGPDLMNDYNLNPLPSGAAFTGYWDLMDPSILNEFAAAAFRFGHSLVRQTTSTASSSFTQTGVKDVSEIFNGVQLTFAHGSNEFLRGQVVDQVEKCDRNVVYGLRNRLFNAELDLPAFNIQRGRDHGTDSWNAYRAQFSLPQATNWNNLLVTHSVQARDALRSIYPLVDDMELFPAGLSENPVPGGIVGSVFGNIIALQFFKLKYGDRFYYETGDPVTGFPSVLRDQIRKSSLAMLYCWAAGVTQVPRKLLLKPDPVANPMTSCANIPSANINMWSLVNLPG